LPIFTGTSRLAQKLSIRREQELRGHAAHEAGHDTRLVQADEGEEQPNADGKLCFMLDEIEFANMCGPATT